MSDTGRLDCVPCNKFRHWLEFQLLDNQGKPLAGIPYHLKSRDGVINARGVTDGQGILREENLSSLPMTLHVEAQKLADQLVEKSTATAVKIAKTLGSSPAIMPGELSDGLPKIEGWTEATLQTRYYADPEYSGITVMPEHNCRHVIAVERIAKPVFAKSCLQPLGCTDAGTETEPATNFGQLQVYLPVSAPQTPAMASAAQNKNTPPWYMVPIGWLLDQVVPPAQANPLIFQAIETQMALNAAAGAAGTASNNEGSWETQSAPPRLSEKEKLFMAAISSTPADRAQAVWGAMKRALGADSDTAQHQLERLKQLADQKGRAETRVRYRFVEDEKTGVVKVVGYHTREGSGMDMVKVRHVKQTAPGTYEFREDGADSPILVWYTTASSMYQALSPQDLPQYFNQRGTPINVNTVPLDDPSLTGQTPGLEIPAQPTWRDGIMVNPQQDPNEMAGNKTETPIADGTDRGPTKTTTPIQESDFRDYILVFPIEGVPAVYVYLSDPYGGTEKGKYSGRTYDPAKAGGPIQDLDWRNVEITQEGLDKVKLHTSRFEKSIDNTIMIERLEKILSGEITTTDYDRRYYTHEIRELERYRAIGVPDGVHDEDIWNHAHAATLEDYKIHERTYPLYTPEAIHAADLEEEAKYK
ncbi:S-type pyocin domain-containing protein [Xenorhabdus griffiniae]|uniref:S-type pyocin domain-containing protein n=1 Tax=Xenorhabdus griffiniae TaxID=351672 RepID=UPI0023582ADE|nr:S-type pyocin domain-containing protein [Xenorhabdus griffiniae]MDC9605271.1 S-type pyocin domain-containing protein [Xenorhabdus griffiniae]